MAAPGVAPVVLINHCRAIRAPPAIIGAACEVPLEAVVQPWEGGQKSVPGPPQTPLAVKQTSGEPVGFAGGSARWPGDWNRPPVRCVPGATRSGLLRPSAQGPRAEVFLRSLALSASLSSTRQASAPPNGWTLFAAPTVMTFLAVPGEPTVLAPGPPLPTEKTMTISWLPATGTVDPVCCASRTSASYRWARAS